MKVTFDNGGYIEFQKSNKPYHVHIMIASKNSNNSLQLLVNSAEIHLSKLLECVKSVSGPLILSEQEKES